MNKRILYTTEITARRKAFWSLKIDMKGFTTAHWQIFLLVAHLEDLLGEPVDFRYIVIAANEQELFHTQKDRFSPGVIRNMLQNIGAPVHQRPWRHHIVDNEKRKVHKGRTKTFWFVTPKGRALIKEWEKEMKKTAKIQPTLHSIKRWNSTLEKEHEHQKKVDREFIAQKREEGKYTTSKKKKALYWWKNLDKKPIPDATEEEIIELWKQLR